MEGDRAALFIEEFDVQYISRLYFADNKVFKAVLKKSQKALTKGLISERSRWRGALYEKELERGYAAPLEIKWLSYEKEYGLVASKDFKKGDYIGEYAGMVRKTSSLDAKNSYCFEYLIGGEKRSRFTIDAREMGNELRFANHCDEPNCETAEAYALGLLHIILLARKPVKKGEELTYDYGPTYWAKRNCPVD